MSRSLGRVLATTGTSLLTFRIAALIQHLTKHGCILLREGANHSVYANPANGQQTTVGRHRELDNLMCRGGDLVVHGFFPMYRKHGGKQH